MNGDRSPGLAAKALSTAERHGQSLKAVNEKLADLVASLRDQKARLSTYARSGAAPGAGTAEVAMDPGHTEATLAAQLEQAREALRRREEQEARLRDRLSEIEAENRRVCDEFVAVQEQNTELVSLYAAIERLHGAPTRDDVLAAIQEVVVNFVGSEEFALFELAADGRRLVPTHALGIDARGLAEIAIGSAAAGDGPFPAGQGGAPWPGEAPPPTAWVPLRLGEKVTGALAIYRLLGHKPALTGFDREIFSLLERHAGLALHFRGPEPRTEAT